MIFLIHSGEDAPIATQIAHGLESAGFACWYYQRNSLPGASYLAQTAQALGQSQVAIPLLSPASLDSRQVAREIEFAHDRGKALLPLLWNLSWESLQQRRPEWHLALGAANAVNIPPNGAGAVIEAIVQGVRKLYEDTGGHPPATEPALPVPVVRPECGSPGPAPRPLGQLPRRSPLVGRTEEITFLREQYQAVADGGGGRLFFLTGEPGIGKTRLAQEIGLFAQSRGALFLAGRYSRDGFYPYAAWVEMLRPVLRGRDRDELLALVGHAGPELAQVFPEIAEGLAPLPAMPSRSSDDQQRRLLDGIAGLIVNLTSQTPIVILLDDLQWAAGAPVLRHLAYRLGESRALVLATFREPEFNEVPSLVQTWTELNRARLFTQLSLPPLGPAETTEVIAHYFGAEAADQLADPVYRTTRGTPFFVEELLRSFAETGVVRPGPAGWVVGDISGVELPASIQLLVRDRVGRLGEEAERVLTQAAVLGREFSYPALQGLTELADDDLIRVLIAAEHARLVVDRSVLGEERYAFTDHRVRDVLYAGLPGPWRRRLHRRAGEVLEELAAGQTEGRLDDLARHFLEGGDAVRGADYSLRAAEANVRVGNWPRAHVLYQRAADALAYVPDSEDNRRRRLETLDRLIWLANRDASLDQIRDRLAEAETLAQTLADPDRWLGRLRYLAGCVYQDRSDYQMARSAFEAALAAADASGDAATVLLCRRGLGKIFSDQGYPSLAIPLLRQATATLEESGHEEWLGTLGAYAEALATAGDFPAAVAEIARGLAHARASHDPWQMAEIALHAATVFFYGGDLEQALEYSRTCIETGCQVGNRLHAYFALGFQAWAESRLGRSQAAEASLFAFKSLGEGLGGGLGYDDWYGTAEAEIALLAGRPAEAFDLAGRTAEYAHSIGGIYAEGLARRVRAEALRTLDPNRADAIEGELLASLRLFEAGGANLEAARTRVVWAQFRRDRGDAAFAREHLALAVAQFEASGLTEERAAARDVLESLPHDAPAVTPGPPRPARLSYPDGLTQREIEILRLLAAGQTSREIATELVLSQRTVERHILNVYTKIGVHNRSQATAYAVTHGLVDVARLHST